MLAAPEVVPVPCNVQTKQQNLLCCLLRLPNYRGIVSKSCARLLTQGCCFKVTFLLLVQQEYGSLQSVAMMVSAVEPRHWIRMNSFKLYWGMPLHPIEERNVREAEVSHWPHHLTVSTYHHQQIHVSTPGDLCLMCSPAHLMTSPEEFWDTQLEIWTVSTDLWFQGGSPALALTAWSSATRQMHPFSTLMLGRRQVQQQIRNARGKSCSESKAYPRLSCGKTNA